ncbi:uncharacterized protein LOC141915192 isoform X2 [Tubulanus polymorphus]|uniref:uncharacterized protein LOC141915192 isoform X2 n=1 Tax=Tubulanus polymorphus TaxID=672921 RepID=UPI003DA63708
MSWLSGGISSLTDQISNFTKEVLTEGTEEVSDHVTELKVAKSKITDLESQNNLQKNENERLKHLIAELEVKNQSLELQNTHISSEYRAILDNKEVELNLLKQQQHELQEQQKLASYSSHHHHHQAQFSEDEPYQSDYAFESDGMDFGDVISSQHEINRLRQEVRRLQTESDRWKNLASLESQNNQRENEKGGSNSVSSVNDDGRLRDQIKDLQQRLNGQIDEHQQELSTLQNVHSQKIANLKKRHKNEVVEYEDKIAELHELLNDDDASNVGEDDGGTRSKLVHELQKLRDENKAFLAKIDDSNDDLRGARDQLRNAIEENEATQTQLKEKENNCKQLEDELNVCKRSIEEHQQMRAEQTVQLEKCRERLDIISSKLRDNELEWNAEKHLLTDNLKRTQESSEQLARDIELVIKQKEELHSQLRLQQDKSGEQDISTNQLKCQLDLSESENTKLVSQNADLHAEIHRLQEEEEQLIQSNQCLESELQTLNDQRETWTNHALEIELLKQTISENEATIGELEASLQQSVASSTLKDIQDVKDRLETDMLQQRSQIAQEKSEIINQLCDLDEQKTGQKFQIEALDAEKQLVLDETAQLVEGIGNAGMQDVTQNLISNLENENTLLKDRVSDLEKVLAEFQGDKTRSDSNLTVSGFIDENIEQQSEFMSTPIGKGNLPLPLPPSSDNDSSNGQSSVVSEHSSDIRGNHSLDGHVRVLENQVEKYEQEIEHFEMVRCDWHSEKQALENVLKQLQNKIREKQESLSVAQAEKNLSDLDQDLEPVVDASDGFSDFSSEIDELYQQIQLLTDSNALLENERDILSSEKELLLKEMQDLRRSNDNLKASLADKDPLDELQKEIDDLSQKLHDKEATVNELTSERDGLMLSLEELDTQHQTVIDKLLETRDSLLKNNENLSQQVVFLEEQTEKCERRINDLKRECNSLRSEREVLQKDLHQAQTEIESCHQEISIIGKDKDEQWQLLKDRNSDLQQQILNLNDDVTRAKKDKETLKLQLDDTNKLETEDRQKIDSLVDKYTSLKSDRDDLIKELTSMKEENDVLKSECAKLNIEIRNKNDAYDSLEMIKNDLEISVSVLEDEVTQARSRQEDLEMENMQLQSSMQTSSADSTSTKNTSADFESQVRSLKLELDRSLTDNAEYETRINELETSISSLSSQNEKLNEALNNMADLRKEECSVDYTKQISELKMIIDALKSEKMTLEGDVFKAEQKVSDTTKHFENYIQEMKEIRQLDTSSLEGEVDRWMNLHHEKELAISELEGRNDQLESDLADSKELLQSTIDGQQPLTDLLNERELEITELKKDNGKLIADLEQKAERMELLMSEATASKDLGKQIINLKEENSKLQQHLNELLSEQDCEKLDAKTLDIITDLESEITKLNSKLVDKNNELQKSTELVNDLQSDLLTLDEQKEESTGQITKLQNQIAQLQENLIQKDEELDNISIELTKYQKSAVSSRESISSENGVICDNDINTEAVCNGDLDDDDDDDIHLSKHDNSSLQKIIADRDEIIAELKNNNSSLLRMLEDKSLSHGNKSLLEIHKLNEQVRLLQMEKEQMMSVMTEKSREASKLKGEVHRLMNVVSAEKVAIEKLQKDNNEIMNRSNPNEDMQKETVKKLAQIIRDKDLEIESLAQKNDTLLQVLQESGENKDGARINDLILERENLSKQLALYQQDREQIIAALNQKHQESLGYHAEVQRLSNVISADSEKHDKLEQDYANLKLQYEDKQQTLLKAQNELINYKQKYSELETRFKELVSSQDGQSVDIRLFDEKCGEINELSQCLKSKDIVISEKDDVIMEKDKVVSELSKKIETVELKVKNKENEIHSLKKQIEKLNFELKELEIKLVDSNKEIEHTQKRSNSQTSEVSALKESHNKLTMLLQEKEFEIQAYKEKQMTLTQLFEEKGERHGNKEDIEQWMKSNEILQEQAKTFQLERDQMSLSLQQKHAELIELQNKAQFHVEREQKLTKELDRLRTHLIQIEEGYTQEALESEEREKELRNKLAMAEDRAQSSSSAIQSANQHASEQVDGLQQQLHLVIEQRDTALHHLAQREEHLKQYAASLANLQMVLEQFQIEKDDQLAAEVEKHQREIAANIKDNRCLQERIVSLEDEVRDAQDALEAASRISEQLDRKEEIIGALKEEVQLREAAAKQAEEEIRKLSSNSEAKVDKTVIKNLFMGYFHTPQNKRQEVLRLIGSILDFTHDDMQQIGAESGGGWLPSWMRRSPAPSPVTPIRTTQRTNRSLDHSFSEMFIKFLENESTPKQNIRLPAEEMAKDVQRMHQKHHRESHSVSQLPQHKHQQPAFNPFSAPRHAAMPIQIGMNSSTSHDSHILINAETPSFSMTPLAPAADNIPGSGHSHAATSSSHILKDVLQKQ